MKKSLKTPCIGICSTVFGDEVCRGCKRYQNEVIDWNGYTDVEKEAVLIRLEALKTQIMRAKVNIFDEEILREKMDVLKIKYTPDVNSYCWTFDLLRQASKSITSLDDFGVAINSDTTKNLSDLKKIIEAELFDLSEAHYQRYFKIEKNHRA
jgi:predicted Fe-S protein YdhL (DUF1289 family)|tara:strand:- start:2743 stop:3198 length:456 start_codon:yes stop_codon:yes gene_type:complete